MGTGARRLRDRARRVAVAAPGARGRALPAAAALGRAAGVLGQPQRAPARRVDHVQGGRRRVRSRLLGRLRPRARARALAPARERPHAVHDRRQRGADRRVRSDHERLVRDALAVVEGRDRRRALLLPRAREHAARPHLGAAGVAGAHALLRSAATRRLRPRPDPEQPAVRLLRLEDRVRTRNDRRCRGGLLRRIHRGAGRADRLGRLGRAVRDGVGGDTRREPARHRRSTRRSRSRNGSFSAGTHRSGQESSDPRRAHEETKVDDRGDSRARDGDRGRGRAGDGRLEPGPGADEGHAPVEVGRAVAVRRLLRGEGEGLLQAGRARREHQGRRAGHPSRAGRARKAGRVRDQLDAVDARTARHRQRPRQHRAGLRPQRARPRSPSSRAGSTRSRR